MKFVFAPAVAVANRLRYTQKFLVAGVLMLISVAVLFGGLYRNLHANMAATQSEMAGISAVTPLLKTIQLLQQHRGLSAGLLGGNPAMKERRAAKEAEVEAAFAATDEQFAPPLRSDEGWRAIRAKWATLKADGLNRSLADNTAFHSALLSDLLIFVGTVSDHYALTLDPDIDSYYLMDTATNRVPLALERLGQMRAMGTGVLAKKAASEAQRIGLSRATGEMQGNMRLLLVNAAKVARYNPGLGDALSGRAQDAAATANDIAEVIASDILGGVFATDAQAFFDRATAAIDKGYQLTYEILLPTLAQLLEQRLARDRLHLGLQFGGMSALLLALAYFFAGMYYSITGNVRLLAEEATQVAGGNLSARVRLDSRDELVTVADGFNRMTDAVGDAVRKVMQESARVADEANRLAGTAAEVATASSHQSESATTMAATVEQVTVSIDVVSKNASDARRVTENSRGASLQGGRLVAQVVDEMESISSTVNQSAQAIRELGEHSQRITTVVGVIREIAEQTNLLALNAAIEAARAGDQGRGFAVVADEVRKLAERTAASTGEIAEMVAAIQGGTAAAVTAMEDGVARVDKGVTLARQAGGSMAAVEQGAEQVMAAVSDISDALKEQSTASLDMARSVERIAQMAEQNSAAVSGAADTARRLETLAQTLRAEVSHFRI